MLNLKPYGNNDATTTKTVSVDFTDACYIHGSNRVQGLAFTNFETPTLVLDVSRAIQFEIFSPDASIAIPRIRKGGFAHLLQLRFIGNIRVLYRLADNDVNFTKTVVIESAAILTSVWHTWQNARFSPSMARDLTILLRQNKISTKQSSRAGSVFVEIGGQSCAEIPEYRFARL